MWSLSCGVCDLIPWSGMEPRPPGLGVWSLSHWTPREISRSVGFLACPETGVRGGLTPEPKTCWPGLLNFGKSSVKTGKNAEKNVWPQKRPQGNIWRMFAERTGLKAKSITLSIVKKFQNLLDISLPDPQYLFAVFMVKRKPGERRHFPRCLLYLSSLQLRNSQIPLAKRGTSRLVLSALMEIVCSCTIRYGGHYPHGALKIVQIGFYVNSLYSHSCGWELDHDEGWVLKNWCFWIVVLQKTLESPLDGKEIKPVNPKRNQHWTFIGQNWCYR